MNQSHSEKIPFKNFALWEKFKNQRKLQSFTLELTARCNNNCRHCYVNLPASDKDAQNQEMSAEFISHIADDAVQMGAMFCLITGGEPLLRKDFTDIYLDLKRKGLLPRVFTNAAVITQDHIDLFKKYPPYDVEVTMYGATAETYDKVTRTPGSFRAFKRGLDLLIENEIPVRLKAMALRSTIHEMQAIADFCRRYTKDYYRFDPQLHLRFDRDAAKNEMIKSERLTPEEVVELENKDDERSKALLDHCDKFIIPALKQRQNNRLLHCSAGNTTFYLRYDGTFQLCSSLNHPDCVYDLKNGSLKEAWEDFVPRVRAMTSDRDEFINGCHRCEFINLCLWCPAHAYLETGELDAPVDYFCRLAHARAKNLQQHLNQEQQPIANQR